MTGTWLSEHPHLQTLLVLVAYWIVSALVNRLPAPGENSGSLYKSLYTALQGFSANLKEATSGVRALMPKPGAAPAPAAPPAKK